MSNLETKRLIWSHLRSVASGNDDFPQATTGYDPVGAPATDRVASKMLTKAGAAMPFIDLFPREDINVLELRFRHSTNNGTCTWHLFAARRNSNDVKYVGSIVSTAGTQAGADGTFFSKTLSMTDYWNKDPVVSAEETGTGMATLEIETLGYDRFWLATTTTDGVSAGTAYVDFSGR